MAEVIHTNGTGATLEARKQALARTLDAKLLQGYRVESQNETQAVLVIKGRKRFFASSVDSRQIVSVDERGIAQFEKVERLPA